MADTDDFPFDLVCFPQLNRRRIELVNVHGTRNVLEGKSWTQT